MGRLLALLAALIAGSWIAFVDEQLPESQPLGAPAVEFAGERAFADVNFLAAVPHPIGSPYNANVRDALVGRMLRLGLSPEVRSGVGVWAGDRAPDRIVAGPVENVVGVLPGRDRNAPALVRQNLQDHQATPPDFLERMAGEVPEGRVQRLPTRADVDPRLADRDKGIREQLIIEFCSR